MKLFKTTNNDLLTTVGYILNFL